MSMPSRSRPRLRWLIGWALVTTLFDFGARDAVAAEHPLELAAHHVVYSVADVDKLAAWYVHTLGFKVSKRFEVGGIAIAWLDIPGFRLGFMQVPGSNRAAAGSPSVAQQGVRYLVFSVANVDEAAHRLVEAGARLENPARTSMPPGIRTANLLDPEGNLIGLYQDLDPANALHPTAR